MQNQQIYKSCSKTRQIVFISDLITLLFFTKVEKILKGSLASMLSPSPSVKIQIMGGKIFLISSQKQWANQISITQLCIV